MTGDSSSVLYLLLAKHVLLILRNKDGYISLGELKLANKEKPIRDIAEVDKKIKDKRNIFSRFCFLLTFFRKLKIWTWTMIES